MHRKINDESLIIKQKFLIVIGHILCFKGAFKNDETLWDAGVKKVSPKLCLLFNTLVLKLSKVKLHLSEQGQAFFFYKCRHFLSMSFHSSRPISLNRQA